MRSSTTPTQTLQGLFEPFRSGIVGIGQTFRGPYGEKPITYLDWTASGRLYEPIERQMLEEVGPYVGNTHSESNITGSSMTEAYHQAHDLIKKHVGAAETDVLLFVGFGMTSAVCKLQRLLGLRIPEQLESRIRLSEQERPVVFVTHMEHHSNQTSWEETCAEVVVLAPAEDGRVDTDDLRQKLSQYADRPVKIGAFTACSNVTGIFTPYHELARIMHEAGGLCFVDFAASAPYVPITMHPADPLEKLDAITFSPHKFLGGPGSSGVLIFDSTLYNIRTPDQPGGGTVLWTNPWGGHRFSPDIEVREDGGTPGFLQAMRAAFAVRLKEKMDPVRMKEREAEILHRVMDGLGSIPGVQVLAGNVRDRLPMISFYIDGVHYNLVVRLLNDRFGVQVRGGCSCAGTYGHYLLNLDRTESKAITDRIDQGDFSARPGWVRASFHPTTTDDEVGLFLDAVAQIQANGRAWSEDYDYSPSTNEYTHGRTNGSLRSLVAGWFS